MVSNGYKLVYCVIGPGGQEVLFGNEQEATRYMNDPMYRATVDRLMNPPVTQGAPAGGEKCRQCNSVLANESGCQVCYTCGWSKC